MNKRKALMEIQKMSIEEKIARLSETDKAYVLGFIEGSLLDNQEQRQGLQAGASSDAKTTERKGQ